MIISQQTGLRTNRRSLSRRGTRPYSARRGYALIELLVVITSVTVILGLCAVTIQALMRVNSEAQVRLSASATFARLASQFRADVHASDGMQLTPGSPAGSKPVDAKVPAGLRLTRGPNIVIQYEARNGRVARDESIAGKRSRHESYLVGKGNVVVFERREEGSRPFVVMAMSRETGKEPLEPPQPLEVLALQGKDRSTTARPKGGQSR